MQVCFSLAVSPLSIIHSPLYTFHYTLSTIHSPLSILHYPFSTIHSPLSTLHYPFSTLHYPLSNEANSPFHPPLSQPAHGQRTGRAAGRVAQAALLGLRGAYVEVLVARSGVWHSTHHFPHAQLLCRGSQCLCLRRLLLQQLV